MGEKNLRIAVLGPLGTYTHEAAFQTFGTDVEYNEQKSIPDVFRVLSPKIPLGVVPQENTIFGNVVETYDLLRTSNTGFVRGEITLKVEHCLLAKKGVSLHQIKNVMSHEQALGQCRDFIAANLPSAHVVKTPSTAAAAQALLEQPPNCAAICSSICATLFEGLEILATNIQNEESNFTRFFIIALHAHLRLPLVLEAQCQMKALLRIYGQPPSSEVSSSSAYDIAKYLKAINLFTTRIDRRPFPGGRPFQDMYFIEVHGYNEEYQNHGGSAEVWAADVESAVTCVRQVGGEITVAGVW